MYKYYPAEYGRQAIIKRRLKLSTLSDVNDPFEFAAINTKNKSCRRLLKVWRDTFPAKTGFVSFCENRKNPVIWSHYAENYKGICLGFDVKENILNKIHYLPERVELSEAELEAACQDESRQYNPSFCFTKFSHWRYESERRAVFPLDGSDVIREENPRKEHKYLYFIPFGREFVLREVILGPNYVETNRREVMNAIGEIGICSIKTGRLAFRSFNVVFQNKKALHKVL